MSKTIISALVIALVAIQPETHRLLAKNSLGADINEFIIERGASKRTILYSVDNYSLDYDGTEGKIVLTIKKSPYSVYLPLKSQIVRTVLQEELNTDMVPFFPRVRDFDETGETWSGQVLSQITHDSDLTSDKVKNVLKTKKNIFLVIAFFEALSSAHAQGVYFCYWDPKHIYVATNGEHVYFTYLGHAQKIPANQNNCENFTNENFPLKGVGKSVKELNKAQFDIQSAVQLLFYYIVLANNQSISNIETSLKNTATYSSTTRGELFKTMKTNMDEDPLNVILDNMGIASTPAALSHLISSSKTMYYRAASKITKKSF